MRSKQARGSQDCLAHVVCVCVASTCRTLLDAWNKQSNEVDAPSRNVWYRMGEELKGATVEVAGEMYVWSCLARVKLDVIKALSREMVAGDAAQGCVLCWKRLGSGPQGHC